MTETISGTITIPSGLSTRPQVKLYLVEGTTETLLQTVTVGVTGTFTLNPTTYNSIYKVVPSYTGVVNNADFNLVFSESQNENVPTLLNPGLVLTSGQKMKSSDINEDGKITISDAFLLGANLTGLIPYNKVFWYTSSNFNSMTISNFNSFTPVDYFIINFTTTPVTLDIKYIVKGDADLSSSSN
jgi:hypothetical protein